MPTLHSRCVSNRLRDGITFSLPGRQRRRSARPSQITTLDCRQVRPRHRSLEDTACRTHGGENSLVSQSDFPQHRCSRRTITSVGRKNARLELSQRPAARVSNRNSIGLAHPRPGLIRQSKPTVCRNSISLVCFHKDLRRLPTEIAADQCVAEDSNGRPARNSMTPVQSQNHAQHSPRRATIPSAADPCPGNTTEPYSARKERLPTHERFFGSDRGTSDENPETGTTPSTRRTIEPS